MRPRRTRRPWRPEAAWEWITDARPVLAAKARNRPPPPGGVGRGHIFVTDRGGGGSACVKRICRNPTPRATVGNPFEPPFAGDRERHLGANCGSSKWAE